MRDLSRIIGFLCKEVIPELEVSLIQALKDIVERAVYIPPEAQGGLWRWAANTLYQHAGLPEGEPWKIRMGNVFNDKEKIPEDWKE